MTSVDGVNGVDGVNSVDGVIVFPASVMSVSRQDAPPVASRGVPSSWSCAIAVAAQVYV